MMTDPRKTRFLLEHLVQVLDAVLQNPRVPADATLSRFFAERKYLGSRDRGFVADNLYQVLRHALRYEILLDGLRVDTPKRQAVAFTVALMSEPASATADPALLADALQIQPRLVASVAERIAGASDMIAALPEPERSAAEFGLPVWFTARLLEQMPDTARDVLAALNRQAPIVLRANRLRTTPEELAAALLEQGVESHPGAISPDALILSRRMNANAIPEFKKGWFELQDEGSQLVSLILDPRPNWKVFDACAGAGGKTLHLAAIMKGRGEVVAHDTNPRRLAEMRPRLVRSSAQNVRTVAHELYLKRKADWAGTFNAVLIDAPCTGTGTLRRNPGARLTLDQEFLERMLAQQTQALEDYAALVKPGGLLLYVTCSLLRAENEDQVEAFLKAHTEFTLQQPVLPPPPAEVPPAAAMLTPEGFLRLDPHHHGADGFFAALMRRG